MVETAIISRWDDHHDHGDHDEHDEHDDHDQHHHYVNQRLDSSRLPPSEFQMGTEQGGGKLDTRFSYQ